MKKLLFTLSIACIGNQSAEAQIFYHDVNPDTTIGIPGGAALGFFAIRPPATSSEFDIFWRPVSSADPYITIAVHGTFGQGQILQNAGYPAKLAAGAAINASGTWKESMDDTLSGGGLGNWVSAAADKYLGFRFKGSGPTSWHYGWIRLTVYPDADSFTVKSWAYNTTVNAPINAGETGSTGISELSRSNQVSLVSGPGQIGFLDLPEHGFHPVQISDLNGRTVLQTAVRYNDRIETSQLAPGLYLVQVNVNGQLYRFKTAW
jgi:hypothetical protein